MADGWPAKADIEIWRGNDYPPVIWAFDEDEDGTPFPLAGSVFVLTIAIQRRVVWTKSSAEPASGLTLDLATSELSWTRTLEESRQIPAGRGAASYEIERRFEGSEETWLEGEVIGRGGTNSDG